MDKLFSSGDKSAIEDEIKEIKSLLKFREGAEGGDIPGDAAFFMKSIPDEVKVLENKEVPVIKYRTVKKERQLPILSLII